MNSHSSCCLYGRPSPLLNGCKLTHFWPTFLTSKSTTRSLFSTRPNHNKLTSRTAFLIRALDRSDVFHATTESPQRFSVQIPVGDRHVSPFLFRVLLSNYVPISTTYVIQFYAYTIQYLKFNLHKFATTAPSTT